MKILKWIMTGIAFLCIAGLAVLIIHREKRGSFEWFVFGLSEGILGDILILGALGLLTLVCLVTMIQHMVSGEGKKLLPGIGAVLLGVPCLLFLLPAMDDISAYKPLQEMKSPDGAHSIYYIQTTALNTGEPCKICYRRAGRLTYEKLFVMERSNEVMLRWGDTWFMYRTTTYKYSDYDE